MVKAYRRTIKVKGQEVKVITLRPRHALLMAFKEEFKKNEKMFTKMGFTLDKQKKRTHEI